MKTREFCWRVILVLCGTLVMVDPVEARSKKCSEPDVRCNQKAKTCGVGYQGNVQDPKTGKVTPTFTHTGTLSKNGKRCKYEIASGTGEVPIVAYDPSPSMVVAASLGAEEAHPAWTPWLNRDAPSGTGDWETVVDFRKTGQVCAEPKQIQCRVRETKRLVKTGLVNGGEQYLCETDVGGICDNRRQQNGVQCSDYEVRFLCPPGLEDGR